MIEDDEFQGIGKKTPYKTPDGFFERVSDTTLQKAKQREQNHKKNLVFWKTVAVAASLFGISLLGYYVFESEKLETKVVAFQEKQIDPIQAIPILEVDKQTTIEEAKLSEPKKAMKNESSQEDLKDVLADLSDEELLQLAAIYKSDTFINESEK